jgi:hypothetical protein
MAEAAGDVLILPTSHGQAGARRMGHAEAGVSRWCISHPWGTDIFYGTAEQAVVHMTKQVAEREGVESKRPLPGNGNTERRA